MKLLAHISDVHFGREDPLLVEGLLEALHQQKPDLIVVSGDLTQRAKKRQFRAARAFLDRLPHVPRIVVPGNHDVSATNLVERAIRPLARYKRFITSDLAPTYLDPEVAIAGLNTVRLLSRKDGRLNAAQVRTACQQLAPAVPEAVRIIVTHHPMDKPAADLKHPLVARSRMAMRQFAAAHVDLFLSGHLHNGLTVATSARYKLPGYSAIVAHAGTAVSTRTRDSANAYNLIHLAPGAIQVQQIAWQRNRFKPAGSEHYRKSPDGWSLLPADETH